MMQSPINQRIYPPNPLVVLLGLLTSGSSIPIINPLTVNPL